MSAELGNIHSVFILSVQKAWEDTPELLPLKFYSLPENNKAKTFSPSGDPAFLFITDMQLRYPGTYICTWHKYYKPCFLASFQKPSISVRLLSVIRLPCSFTFCSINSNRRINFLLAFSKAVSGLICKNLE